MSEYEILISKLDLLKEKLEFYKQSNDEKIDLIRKEIAVFQDASDEKLEAFQDANKQQLNVSLGVLVTSAIAVIVAAVVKMN